MPFDVIAVEIVSALPEQTTSAELEGTLLDACTRAAQIGRCVASSGLTEPVGLAARVTWLPGQGVRIQIGPPEGEEPGASLSREVTFAEGDAPAERFRAAGFLLGTLASVLTGADTDLPVREAAFPSGEEAKPAPAEPAPAASPVAAAPRAPERARPSPLGRDIPAPDRRSAWLEAGPAVGNALGGALRLGVTLSGALHLTGNTHACVGAAYSESLDTPRDVTTRWVEGMGGALVTHDLDDDLSVGARLEAIALHLAASLEGAETRKQGDRLTGGVRLGVGGQLWLTTTLGVSVEGSAQWLAGSTKVSADDGPVGTSSTLGYVMRAGALVRLF